MAFDRAIAYQTNQNNMTIITKTITERNVTIQRYCNGLFGHFLWRVYIDGHLHKDCLKNKPNMNHLLDLYGN